MTKIVNLLWKASRKAYPEDIDFACSAQRKFFHSGDSLMGRSYMEQSPSEVGIVIRDENKLNGI